MDTQWCPFGHAIFSRSPAASAHQSGMFYAVPIVDEHLWTVDFVNAA